MASPFPVRVGRDVQRARPLGRLLQLVEHLLLGGKHLVLRLEALLLVHAELGLGQIADVPHRGLDDVLRVQILLDRLDLRGRLHHHQRPRLTSSPRPLSYPRPTRTNRLPSICRTRPSSSSSSRSAADTRPPPAPLRSITSSIVDRILAERREHAGRCRHLSTLGRRRRRLALSARPCALPSTQACQRAGSAATTSSAVLDERGPVLDEPMAPRLSGEVTRPGTASTSRPSSAAKPRGDQRAALLRRLHDHHRERRAPR